jgi:hypothetical protein
MLVVVKNGAGHVFDGNVESGSSFTTAIYQQVDPSERNIASNFE